MDGIKWDLPLGESESRTYSITFNGFVAEGEVIAAVKNGDGLFTAAIVGPSCSQPEIDLEKYVTADGGATWSDADDAPGVEVEQGGQVSYRFVVTNTGNTPLTGLTLSDDMVDTGVCTLPDILKPDASYECIVGPFDVVDGTHTNIATVTGTIDDQTVEVIDTATITTETEDDDTGDDGDIIIVIEGPVQAIEGNVIVIYGFDIELDPSDPVLTVIQIGDILRIQGSLSGDVIIVVTIIFINVDVVIQDGIVWRDDGSCLNAPPPWAPANGWRARCENVGNPGNGGNGGRGGGRGGSGSRSGS